MPALVRALPLLPLGETMGTKLGWQPLGYLFDIGFTRDVWMHRVDIARATGRPLELTAGHDGRIVADILAEWASRHGEPFSLRLTGRPVATSEPAAAAAKPPLWTPSTSPASCPAAPTTMGCCGTNCRSDLLP